MICPKCKSTNIRTERSPIGEIKCNDCGFGVKERGSKEKILPITEQEYPMPPVKEPKKEKGFGQLYKEWCGVHRLNNSCKKVHDSAEAIEFAEYCVEYLKN